MKPMVANQQRPAERPEYKIVPMTELRRERAQARPARADRYPIGVSAEVLDNFERVAEELRIPVDALATSVLEAFIDLVNEDHTIAFPLAFQQVESVQ